VGEGDDGRVENFSPEELAEFFGEKDPFALK